MNTRKNFVFRSLALEKGLNERLILAAKLDDRSVSAILRRGMLKEIARIEAEHEELLPPPLPVMRELERIETEHGVLSSSGEGVSVWEKSQPLPQIVLSGK